MEVLGYYPLIFLRSWLDQRLSECKFSFLRAGCCFPISHTGGCGFAFEDGIE